MGPAGACFFVGLCGGLFSGGLVGVVCKKEQSFSDLEAFLGRDIHGRLCNSQLSTILVCAREISQFHMELCAGDTSISRFVKWQQSFSYACVFVCVPLEPFVFCILLAQYGGQVGESKG